jgi:hypothetical protein
VIQHRDSLPFSFGSRIVSKVIGAFYGQRCPGPFDVEGQMRAALLPLLGYLDHPELRRCRNDSLRSHGGLRNAPVFRLCEKRLLAVTPSDRFQDPYIVAVLLAMAQTQRRRASQQRGPCAPSTSSYSSLTEAASYPVGTPSILLLRKGLFLGPCHDVFRAYTTAMILFFANTWILRLSFGDGLAQERYHRSHPHLHGRRFSPVSRQTS